ncbi:hypothetical protein QYE76_032712 [Lolium multiflorum]|uniref:Retrotransposon gag domain-containing protein n=1 Tax=Lolium multiflorum TaxID=4521 RepID=A0AAD8QW10_LOLMU|nr:hypothetical protein QYE76_032712 [Lolium multiflorum]
MDAIAQSDILNKPITPDDAADPEALEAKRKEMLATAKKFANTAAAMLDERKEAAHFVDNFLKREREVDESLEKVKQLRKHWEAKPFTTPKDNMKKAVELLKKKDEEIDINYVCTLVASAMKQQSKADTSRRLESNPDHCISTAQKDACDNQHRDHESRTGSTERRRKTREHPNPIPVPSKTPLRQIRRRERMQCTLVGTSTGTRHLRPTGTRVLHLLAAVVQSETLGLMGLVESISATTCRLQGTETGSVRQNLTEAGTTIGNPSPGGVGMKIASRSPAGAGTTEATITKEKVATEAGVSRGKNAGNPRAEAKNPTDPLAGPARIWLSDLEKKSIFCWFDLKNAFKKHFRVTYKRPATTSDLHACIPKKGETSRSFLTRWLQTRNECENVDNRTVMHAFIGRLQRGSLLRDKLTCLVNENKLILDDMINIASNHTAADDDAGGELAPIALPLHQQKKNRDNNSNNNRKNPSEDQKSGGSDMVAIAFQRGGQGGGRGRGRGGGAGRGQQLADEVTAAGTRAPKPTRSTETCPAWPIWIRLRASPLTPTATANGSIISNLTRQDTSEPEAPPTRQRRQGQEQGQRRGQLRGHGRG